jgi:hypothetical protein
MVPVRLNGSPLSGREAPTSNLERFRVKMFKSHVLVNVHVTRHYWNTNVFGDLIKALDGHSRLSGSMCSSPMNCSSCAASESAVREARTRGAEGDDVSEFDEWISRS